jgi:hypothetical protein
VLREDRGGSESTYTLLETREGPPVSTHLVGSPGSDRVADVRVTTAASAAAAAAAAEEDESHVAATGGHDAAEMRVYESYIKGMLGNFKVLPLGRIHNMLKVRVSLF